MQGTQKVEPVVPPKKVVKPYPYKPSSSQPDPNQKLINALAEVNTELKKASSQFFEFDITQESLFNVENKNQDLSKVIKKYLDIILWVHWKSKNSMNSYYQVPVVKPEYISVEKLSHAKLFGPISEELICTTGSKPTLSKKNLQTFEKRFDQILEDYKFLKIDNYNDLKSKINNLKNLVSEA